MTAARHTLLPWAFDPDSGELYYDDGDVCPVIAVVNQEGVSEAQARADGELIVRGANHHAALVHTGRGLFSALLRYGHPMSDEAWRNAGDDAAGNGQASVEARALHRAAIAFGAALAEAQGIKPEVQR